MAIIMDAAQERDGGGYNPPSTQTVLPPEQTVDSTLPEGYRTDGVYTGPPTTPTPVGMDDPNPDMAENPDPTPDPPVTDAGVTIQDLYGEGNTDATPQAPGVDTPTVPGATGATVRNVDLTGGAGTVGTPGSATSDPGGAIQQGINAANNVGTAEQTTLAPEQQVDAELVRILGQDSPYLAQARANAARMANQRGLMNSSMAAGMSQAEAVKAALPMAQQNAAQAFQREQSNTELRQQAGQFSAQEVSRLRALEAELGTNISVFNAEQLNQAEALAGQMRTAIAQQDADAYNRAEMQLADLQRSAEAQQADINMAGAQQTAAEQQAYNQQIIDRVTQLNQQYLQGEQAMDLASIQGEYQQIISTNETAASLYQSYMNGIAGIMNDPKMTSQQVASAINTMQGMLESSLRMMSELNGLEIDNVGGNPTNPTPNPNPDR